MEKNDNDLLSVEPYPGYNGETLSLSLLKCEEGDDGVFSENYEAYGFYTMADFYQLATSVGINRAAAKKLFEKMIFDIEKHLPILCQHSCCSTDDVDAIQGIINKRILNLRQPNITP